MTGNERGRARALVAVGVGVVVLAGLAGCTGPTETTLEPGRMEAQITGATQVAFQAEGHYHHSGVEGERGEEFSLGAGMDSVETLYGLLLWTYEGRPEVGVYPLGLPGGAEGALHHLGFTEAWPSDRSHVSYVAMSGELEITAVSGDRIEGRFEFAAFEYCRWGGVGDPEGVCRPPAEPISGAATIAGTGTFSAVPISELGQPVPES